MPSSSVSQHNLMEGVSHNPAFAKKMGIAQSVGQDFAAADKKAGKFKRGGPNIDFPPDFFPPVNVEKIADALPDKIKKDLNTPSDDQPPPRKPPVPTSSDDDGTPLYGGYARGGITVGQPTHLAGGGFINSAIPGRTDRIPMSVTSDSYIIPADVISGLGQGSSLAGAHIMDEILKTGPYGTQLTPHRGGNTIPHAPAAFKESDALAKGGASKKVSVIVAGGEYRVAPDQVMRLGRGSMKRGHQLLDSLIKNVRTHTIKTLKKLPPPKR